MKTCSKSMKIIGLLFFAIFLYTCEDGLIETQDTLFTETDQNMSRPGNGNGNGGGNDGGVIYYNVEINNTFGIPWESDIIVTNDIDCVGSNSTKQDLVWFDDGCDTKFTTKDTDTSEASNATELYLSNIRLGGVRKIDSLYGVRMFDTNGNNYVGEFIFDSYKPFGNEVITIPPNVTINVNKKEGKGKNVTFTPSGSIRLGEIVMTPISTEESSYAKVASRFQAKSCCPPKWHLFDLNEWIGIDPALKWDVNEDGFVCFKGVWLDDNTPQGNGNDPLYEQSNVKDNNYPCKGD